jgi:hypothetical protein
MHRGLPWSCSKSAVYHKDARMSHEYQCNDWGAKSGKMHNLPILNSSSHLLLYPSLFNNLTI